MDEVKFEQMLSFRPSHQDLCLRDFIFDYFARIAVQQLKQSSK